MVSTEFGFDLCTDPRDAKPANLALTTRLQEVTALDQEMFPHITLHYTTTIVAQVTRYNVLIG